MQRIIIAVIVTLLVVGAGFAHETAHNGKHSHDFGQTYHVHH